MVKVILICGEPTINRSILIIVSLLTQVWQLMREVIDVVSLVHHHRWGTEVDEETAAVAQ